MNNNNFISINGNIYNAAYITTIRKISDDNEQEYIIRVDYVNKTYDDVFYDSAFKRDEDFNRVWNNLSVDIH